MSQDNLLIQTVPRWLLVLALLSVPAFGMPAVDSLNACAQATPISANGTEHGFSVESGEARILAVEVPAPGFLVVDVAVPGPAVVEPKLGFLGRNCTSVGFEKSSFTLLEQSPTHLVLRIPGPGSYFFRVAAQDLLLPLGPYRVRTRFVDAGVQGMEKVEEWQEEIEPAAASAGETEGGGQDTAPAPPEKVEEWQEEIEPAAASCSQVEGPKGLPGSRSAAGRPPLCISDESDDHGDTALCATPVAPGSGVLGEITNGWGDDRDTFTFLLSAQRTVRIESAGDLDTFGGLYDRHGQRLAADDDAGSGSNFRIVKTLTPGRYFVRVEGHEAAEGPFTLTVEALEW